MKVVDASVAFKWFKDEAGSGEGLALLASEPVIAPELILAEVLNAAWLVVRRGVLAPLQADGACAELPAFLDCLAPLAASAAAAARLLDHPVHDRFCLALAEREAVGLVTADTRPIARTAGTRWVGLGAPLQPTAGGR